MLIESKLRREGGSRIQIGNETYHFAPDGEGRHVCEVTNKAHIQRFLSITEGFRLVGAEDEEQPAPPPPSGDPLSGDAPVEMVDDENDEADDESIDDLDLDELAERYEAAGVKMDRRRSLRVLRSELRRIEAGE